MGALGGTSANQSVTGDPNSRSAPEAIWAEPSRGARGRCPNRLSLLVSSFLPVFLLL